MLGKKSKQFEGYVAKHGVVPPWLREGGGADFLLGYRMILGRVDGRLTLDAAVHRFGGSNPTPQKWDLIAEVPVFMPVAFGVGPGGSSDDFRRQEVRRQLQLAAERGISAWLLRQLVEDSELLAASDARDESAPVGSAQNPVQLIRPGDGL